MESSIEPINTIKKCKICEGKFMLEKYADNGYRYTILFCENHCFQKIEKKKMVEKEHAFGEYIMINNIHYLRNNKNYPYFQQAIIDKNKKGLRVRLIGQKIEESKIL